MLSLVLSLQLKNKGLQTQFGDNSSAVDRGTIAFSMEHYAQKAAFFEQRLIRYLLKNKALYPVFTSSTNKDTDLRPQIDNCHCITNGMYDCNGSCGNNDNGYNNSILIL
jgi:hypothetical protein